MALHVRYGFLSRCIRYNLARIGSYCSKSKKCGRGRKVASSRRTTSLDADQRYFQLSTCSPPFKLCAEPPDEWSLLDRCIVCRIRQKTCVAPSNWVCQVAVKTSLLNHDIRLQRVSDLKSPLNPTDGTWGRSACARFRHTMVLLHQWVHFTEVNIILTTAASSVTVLEMHWQPHDVIVSWLKTEATYQYQHLDQNWRLSNEWT